MMDFNAFLFRQQFPYFQQADAAVYLDSAATALKPAALIEATCDFYQSAGSVHRSQYDEKQTALYEQARAFGWRNLFMPPRRKQLFGPPVPLTALILSLMDYPLAHKMKLLSAKPITMPIL